MSSLRLAIKQSIQESGPASSSSDRRKKKVRQKMYSPRSEGLDDEENPNNNVSNRKTSKKAETRKTGRREKSEDGNNSDSSEENEFYADEDNDDNERSSDQDEDDDENDNSDDGFDSRSFPMNSDRMKVHRKSPDHHDEHRKHTAAHKIQSRWKVKQESKPLEDDDEQEKSRDTDTVSLDGEKLKATTNDDDDDSSLKKNSSTEPSSRNKQKNSGSKKRTKKAMTVSPPDPSLIEWMSSLPVETCRNSILPGMRVKVRFAVKRKIKGADNEKTSPNQPPLKEKKKWYGGRVCKVSKRGTKIRIKYDDETIEDTKFPDEDIVIDESGNGTHKVPVDVFLPPSKSPRSSEVKATVSYSMASDLVDTPLQHSQSGSKILLSNLTKIALDNITPEEVVDQKLNLPSDVSNNESLTEMKRSFTFNEESMKSDEAIDNNVSDVSVPVRKNLSIAGYQLPSVDLERQDSGGMEQEKNTETRKSDLTTSLEPEDYSVPTGNAIIAVNGDIMGAITCDQNIEPSASEGSLQPKLEQVHILPSVLPKDNSFENEPMEYENVFKVKAEEESPKPKRKLSSLKIRIPGNRLDSEKSPRFFMSSDEQPKSIDANLTEFTRVGDKKKLHIHIPSKHALQDEERPLEIDTEMKTVSSKSQSKQDAHFATSPSRQKRKVISDSAISLIISPSMSPKQRKKKKKILYDENAFEARGPKSDLLETINESVTQQPDKTAEIHGSKTIRIPKSSLMSSGTDSASNNKSIALSKGSAFENVSQARDNAADGVTSSSKSDAADQGSSRSGRRAAQQANDRISTKQDSTVSDKLLVTVKKKKKNKESALIRSPDDRKIVEKFNHVMCDKCKKWRIIPSSVVDSLPVQWFCSDNIYDPKRAFCEAPEQTDNEVTRKRKKKLKNRLMQKQLEGSAIVEATAVDNNLVEEHSVQEKKSSAGYEKSVERVSSPPPVRQWEEISASKSQELSPVEQFESASESHIGNGKQERRLSSLGKKGKPMEQPDRISTVDSSEGGRRGRGRPRRSQFKENSQSENCNFESSKGDDDNIEWVQCEKCEKWRRLPSHIRAAELPGSWYCEMNYWTPESASCEVPQDKDDGVQDIGGIGGVGSGLGKLTYRNLIFGSTGRKANRTITEKARAAESLFSIHQEEEDFPSRVLYADSCAFICRGRPNLPSGENENPSVLELMSHSHLWNKLRHTEVIRHSNINNLGPYDMAVRMASFTYDTLPAEIIQSMRDLVLFYLGDMTVSSEQLLERGQATIVSNLSTDIEKAREYWNINVLVTTLAQLVKEGIVSCINKSSDGSVGVVERFCPYYRRVVPSSNHSTVSNESQELSASSRSVSRLLKIAKPWKNRFHTDRTCADMNGKVIEATRNEEQPGH